MKLAVFLCLLASLCQADEPKYYDGELDLSIFRRWDKGELTKGAIDWARCFITDSSKGLKSLCFSAIEKIPLQKTPLYRLLSFVASKYSCILLIIFMSVFYFFSNEYFIS